MHGMGTIVNAIAIIIGTVAGVLVRSGLPDRLQKIIMEAAGLATMFIGISGAMAGMLVMGPDGLETRDTMIMIFSLILGGITGELINIELQMERMGDFFKKLLIRDGNDNSSFSEAFVSASLIYCVGAMAIVGSLNDGLLGDPSVLYAKSVLDGVISVVLAATLGPGVALSALSVGVYQGGITLLSGFIKPWLSGELVRQISFVGSILIFTIGLNFLFPKKVKTGNLMPAMFFPILLRFLPF